MEFIYLAHVWYHGELTGFKASHLHTLRIGCEKFRVICLAILFFVVGYWREE